MTKTKPIHPQKSKQKRINESVYEIVTIIPAKTNEMIYDVSENLRRMSILNLQVSLQM